MDQRLLTQSILPETLTQGGWQGEIISLKKDGNEFHSLLSKSLIYDENKVTVAVVEVLTDISERIKLEEQLLQSQKMETVGNLAGGIAHDFNNLLTVINGYTELVLMKYGGHEDDPMHRQLEEILNAGRRAENLTQQLLIFSRREISHPKILKMGKIVSGIEKMLNRLIGDNIELISNIVTDYDYFYADQGQIEHILTNLIVNARDAMSGAGKIVIKSQCTEIKKLILSGEDEIKPGWYLMLSISDTGCGMSKETITKIFDPFFTTKQVGQGTGFGLSTVYGIVKKWRGFIDVTSEIGQGTTFNIYFPSAKEKPEEIETVIKDGKDMSGNETVLVAEDEDDVRNLVCHVLGMNGYKILEAPHGGSALLKCEQFKDTIILSYVML